jgi:hypothetical protein
MYLTQIVDFLVELDKPCILCKLSSPEYDEITRAVRESGDSKTEWVRKKLIAAARRT